MIITLHNFLNSHEVFLDYLTRNRKNQNQMQLLCRKRLVKHTIVENSRWNAKKRKDRQLLEVTINIIKVMLGYKTNW